MVDFLLYCSCALILAGVVLALYRLVKGDTNMDRVIAIDQLTLISLAVIVIIAHIENRFIYIDVAIVYGLLSFLGVLAVARHIEKGL